MGLIRFQPAKRPQGGLDIRSFPIVAANSFARGAPVTRGSTPSQVQEHGGGATVTGILGTALVGADTGVPDGKGSTSYGTEVLVALADTTTEWIGTLYNSGVVEPDSDNLGVSYGIVKVSGEWYVDESDTSNVVLKVTGIFASMNAVLFKWISTAIQT